MNNEFFGYVVQQLNYTYEHSKKTRINNSYIERTNKVTLDMNRAIPSIINTSSVPYNSSAEIADKSVIAKLMSLNEKSWDNDNFIVYELAAITVLDQGKWPITKLNTDVEYLNRLVSSYDLYNMKNNNTVIECVPIRAVVYRIENFMVLDEDDKESYRNELDEALENAEAWAMFGYSILMKQMLSVLNNLNKSDVLKVETDSISIRAEAYKDLYDSVTISSKPGDWRVVNG